MSVNPHATSAQWTNPNGNVQRNNKWARWPRLFHEQPNASSTSLAHIFEDHYSDLSYAVHKETDTAEETLAAKRSFKAYARTHNVKVQHYREVWLG
jgi:hypothetical protein